mmetsp:Transcript_50439/g.153385  ORF Transcript_50439/g.153385 Transcript_50439/m.153385 type:complete len:267 (-) Transcript_50439:1064-1864(-)
MLQRSDALLNARLHAVDDGAHWARTAELHLAHAHLGGGEGLPERSNLALDLVRGVEDAVQVVEGAVHVHQGEADRLPVRPQLVHAPVELPRRVRLARVFLGEVALEGGHAVGARLVLALRRRLLLVLRVLLGRHAIAPRPRKVLELLQVGVLQRVLEAVQGPLEHCLQLVQAGANEVLAKLGRRAQCRPEVEAHEVLRRPPRVLEHVPGGQNAAILVAIVVLVVPHLPIHADPHGLLLHRGHVQALVAVRARLHLPEGFNVDPADV